MHRLLWVLGGREAGDVQGWLPGADLSMGRVIPKWPEGRVIFLIVEVDLRDKDG